MEQQQIKPLNNYLVTIIYRDHKKHTDRKVQFDLLTNYVKQCVKDLLPEFKKNNEYVLCYNFNIKPYEKSEAINTDI